MVDEKTLPANSKVTHKSLFDGSLQGFELTDAPVFCFQGFTLTANSGTSMSIQDLF